MQDRWHHQVKQIADRNQSNLYDLDLFRDSIFSDDIIDDLFNLSYVLSHFCRHENFRHRYTLYELFVAVYVLNRALFLFLVTVSVY